MTRRFKKPWSGSALTQGRTRQGKAYARPGAPFLLVSGGKQIGNKQIPFLAVPIAVSSTDDPLREGRKKPARLRLPTQHLSHCSRRVKISEPRSRICKKIAFLLLDFGCMVEEHPVFSHGFDNIHPRNQVSFSSLTLTI